MQFNTFNKAQAFQIANNMTSTHTVERINLLGNLGYYYTLVAINHGAAFEFSYGQSGVEL